MVKFIVHLADIHIRTFRLHDEYRSVFDNLINEFKTKLCNYKREELRIVIAGDLVHQKITISNEQILLATYLLKALEEIAPVVIIAGNHDLLENNKDRIDSITPIHSLLSDKQITYHKESKCYLDDNIVWCAYSIFEGNSKPDIESARLKYGPDKKYIGLFHAPILNAKTDTGYSIDHGASLDIFDGCDAVMLGDIHKHQSFIHKDIQIVFVGSTIQQNFGETVSKHGYVIWNVETLKWKHFEVKNDVGLYHFKINSLADLENNTEKIINL